MTTTRKRKSQAEFILERQIQNKLFSNKLKHADYALDSRTSFTYASPGNCGKLAFNHQPRRRPLLALGLAKDLSLNILEIRQSTEPRILSSTSPIHDHWITAVEWSKDDRLVFTCSEDQYAKIHDVHAGKIVSTLGGNTGLRTICELGSSAQASLCVALGGECGVTIWDQRAVNSPSRLLPRQGAPITGLASTEDGLMLLTCNMVGMLQIWDVRQQKLVSSFNKGGSQRVGAMDYGAFTSVKLYRSDTRALISSEKGGILSVDLVSLATLPEQETRTQLPVHPGAILNYYRGHQNLYNLRSAVLTKDEENVVCGSDDGSVWVWDEPTGKCRMQLKGEGADEDVVPAEFTQRPIMGLAVSSTLPCHIVASTDLALLVFQTRFGKKQVPCKQFWQEGESMGVDDWPFPEEEEEEKEDWEADQLHLQEGECSYGRGYARQNVFVCDTCMELSVSRGKPRLPHGICAQCAELCHEMLGHEVRNIGEKKNFRCDCGNSLFENCGQLAPHLKCSLEGNKDAINSNNSGTYNHNFFDRWCYCDSEEQRPMIQCVSCLDWFHGQCLQPHDFNWEQDEFADEDMLCDDCLEGPFKFLSTYPAQDLTDRPGYCRRPAEETAGHVEPPTLATNGASHDGDAKQPAKCQACKKECLADQPLLQCDGKCSEGKSCGDMYHANCLPFLQSQADKKSNLQKSPLGWHVHRGRFLPNNWILQLAEESDKQAACQALGILEGPEVSSTDPPSTQAVGSSSSNVAREDGDSSVVNTRHQRRGAIDAGQMNSLHRSSEASLTAMSATGLVPLETTNTAGAGDTRPGRGERDLDAEIRRAVAEGDEATAFRLATQKIMLQVCQDADENRRSIIQSQDINRAVTTLRQSMGDQSAGTENL